VKRSEVRPGPASALHLLWSALALAAVVLSTATAAGASLTHACSARNLRLSSIRLRTTATVTYWDLAFRDHGSTSCHLRGYPAVRLLGRGSKPLPDRFSRVTTPVQTVTVRPKGKAFFTVLYVPGARCRRDRHYAYGIRATPPGSARSLTVTRRRFAVCDKPAGGRPNISPVRSRLNDL
jgi:hypothetical protein